MTTYSADVADHVVRVTIRFHVGTYVREADLSLPVSSPLGEIVGEIVSLVGAPKISRPWHAATSAGATIPMSAPLADTSVRHGSVIVLTPRHEELQPVIRDAAETLADAADAPSWRAFPVAAGLAASPLAGLVAGGAWGPTVGLAVALGALGLLLIFHRDAVRVEHSPHLAATVSLLVIAAATVSALGWVAASAHPDAAKSWLTLPDAVAAMDLKELGWATFAACVASLATLTVLSVFGIAGVRLRAGVLSATLVTCVWAAMLFAPNAGDGSTGVPDSANPAAHGVATPDGHGLLPAWAAATLASLALVALAPAVSTALGGLAIPTLPAAGQAMTVADHGPNDHRPAATAATATQAGWLTGVSVAQVAATVGIATRPGWLPVAICACLMVAWGLHALRHFDGQAGWALWVMSLAAVAGAALGWQGTYAHQDIARLGQSTASMWIMQAACLLIVLAWSSPWWSGRLSTLSPTSLVWVERLEAVAIIIAIPLLLHAAGLFDAIRGL